MKIIKLVLNKIETSTINEIKRTFDNGGVFVFPSDTVYGLAADPQNTKGLDKIYKIKHREKEKSLSRICASIQEIEEYCQVSKPQRQILEINLPGPFTFIVYGFNNEKIGVRIPNSPYTKFLSESLDRPFTSTSANISNKPDKYSITELLKQLENQTDLPDLILDAGILPKRLPSTVVDLTSPIPKILRQGSGYLRFK